MPPLENAKPLIPPPGQKDPRFLNAAFEELQISYPKDPMHFATMHNRFLKETENPQASANNRSQSAQNLCLLDLSIANLKANSQDAYAARIFYKESAQFLNQAKDGHVKDELKAIADEV